MAVEASQTVRLTDLTTCGGCAAKWGASLLRELVSGMASDRDGLLVGLAPSDDAAVVQVAPDVALVSTNFFPPLVDDPGDYGAIAAANVCSDVFAMGGDVLRPGAQFTKGGARPGDALVLSKALGTGLALASGDEATIATAVASMRGLNRDAARALPAEEAAVHAVTDLTGFGLLGHGWEMAERSQCHLAFDAARLPALAGVLPVAEAGVRTGGHARNREYVAGHVELAAGDAAAALGFDPQTSGGLLAAVDPAAVGALAAAGFVPVGQVTAGPPGVSLR